MPLMGTKATAQKVARSRRSSTIPPQSDEKDARWFDDAPSSCLPFDGDPYVANVLLVTNSGRLSLTTHQLLSVVSEIGVRSVER
jgi:hypothetical protein